MVCGYCDSQVQWALYRSEWIYLQIFHGRRVTWQRNSLTLPSPSKTSYLLVPLSYASLQGSINHAEHPHEYETLHTGVCMYSPDRGICCNSRKSLVPRVQLSNWFAWNTFSFSRNDMYVLFLVHISKLPKLWESVAGLILDTKDKVHVTWYIVHST